LVERDLLRNEGSHIIDKSTFTWHKYSRAFDLEHTGLFYQNSEGLLKVYDTLVIEKAYEINGRMFLPTSSNNGTTKRFIRTPRSSILSRSSARAKNLKTAFDKASVFNVNTILIISAKYAGNSFDCKKCTLSKGQRYSGSYRVPKMASLLIERFSKFYHFLNWL
jgi:hypothetical protein